MPIKIEKKTFKTASTFLNALSSRRKPFSANYDPEGWIFRGQSDSTWELQPRVLRTSPAPYLMGSMEPWEAGGLDGWEQVSQSTGLKALVRHEIVTARGFAELIHRSGLHLPGSGYRSINREINRCLSKLDSVADTGDGCTGVYWPTAPLEPLVALMQHYGLATRLLDWTTNPFIASYFAAIGYLKKSEQVQRNKCYECGQPPKFSPAKYICVWCLSLNRLDTPGITNGIKIIRPPMSENDRMFAQSGLFTLDELRYEPRSGPILETFVDRRGLDKVLDSDHIHMLKYQLPGTQCAELLWLLAKERINASAIKPGYEGIADALFEQRLWRELWVDNIPFATPAVKANRRHLS